MSQYNVRLGIGSFAFRYAIGFNGFEPDRPMDAICFLNESHNLGFKGIQLCENLRYSTWNDSELLAVKRRATELGMFLEVGMNSVSKESLNRHLDIAELLSSNFVRVVLGEGSPLPEKDCDRLKYRAIDAIRAVLPRCRQQGIKIGIENHFDLPSKELLEIVQTISDDHIGLILDTTNGLGFVEPPEKTMDLFEGHILSVHLKDFEIKKIEAGYMMTGTELGKGNLKTGYILSTVFKHNPVVSVIMEMTIRRQEKQLINEVVDWEKNAVANSARKLSEIFQSYL